MSSINDQNFRFRFSAASELKTVINQLKEGDRGLNSTVKHSCPPTSYKIGRSVLTQKRFMKAHSIRSISVFITLLLFSIMGCVKSIDKHKIVEGVAVDSSEVPWPNLILTFTAVETGTLGKPGRELDYQATTDRSGRFKISLPFNSKLKEYFIVKDSFIPGYEIVDCPPVRSSDGFVWLFKDTTNTDGLRIILKKLK